MSDWYPKASKSQTYSTSDGRKYTSGYAKKGVLHTTEGTSWPGYENGSMAPHFTIQPLTGEVRQHYPISYPSKALYQPDSPPTNKGGAIQIEIIGTCDPSKKGKSNWNFIPGQTAEQLKGLADLMRWIESNAKVLQASAVTFRAYPGSYGAPTGRLSSSSWKTYNGWCGHQHVPSNNHGDPGNINITSLLAGSTPTPEPKPPSKGIPDMIYCTSSDGRGWLIGVGVKTLINTPATRDKLLAAGVPNAGTWPGDVLNEFPTREGQYDEVNSKLNTVINQTK